MTDQRELAATDVPGAPGPDVVERTPDVARRRLAKAVLAAPVVMTLAPRSVLGQQCLDVNVLSIVLASVVPAGGVVPSVAARGLGAEVLEDCNDCVEQFDDPCPDGQTRTDADVEGVCVGQEPRCEAPPAQSPDVASLLQSPQQVPGQHLNNKFGEKHPKPGRPFGKPFD